MDKQITILICPHVVDQTILSLTYSYLSVIYYCVMIFTLTQGHCQIIPDANYAIFP